MALAFALILGSMSAFAAVQILSRNAGLSFSGNTATCTLQVRDAGKYIDATLELWSGNSCVMTWQETGLGAVTITETYNCTSGNSYYLKGYGTSGTQDFEVIVPPKTCP